MNTPLPRSLLTVIAIIASCLSAASFGQAPLCPTPLPFDDSRSPPFSPKIPRAGDEVFFWVIGAQVTLDASSVTRTGNQIQLIDYLTFPDTLPSAPPNCFPISLGHLPAGQYAITETLYYRAPGGAYSDNPPLVGTYPTFLVQSITTAIVPGVSDSCLIALAALIGLLGMGSLRSRMSSSTFVSGK